jgi:hypothetical protein
MNFFDYQDRKTAKRPVYTQAGDVLEIPDVMVAERPMTAADRAYFEDAELIREFSKEARR